MIEAIVGARWKRNVQHGHKLLIPSGLAISAKYHGASDKFIDLMRRYYHGPTAQSVRYIIRQMASSFIEDLDNRMKVLVQSSTTPLNMSTVPVQLLRKGADVRREFAKDLFDGYKEIAGEDTDETGNSANLYSSFVQFAIVCMQDNHNPISIKRTVQVGGLAIDNSMVSRIYTLLRIQPVKLPNGEQFLGLDFKSDRQNVSAAVDFGVLHEALESFETNNFGADVDVQANEHNPIYLREKLKRHLDDGDDDFDEGVCGSGLKNIMPSIPELRRIESRDKGFLPGATSPFDADKIKTGVSLHKDFCPSPHRRGVTSRMVNLFYGFFVDLHDSLIGAGADPDNLPDMICPLDPEFVLLNSKFMVLLDLVETGAIFNDMTDTQKNEAEDLVADIRKYAPFIRRNLLAIAAFHTEMHIQESVMLQPLNFLNVFSPLMIRIGYRSIYYQTEQRKVARDVANLLRTPKGGRYAAPRAYFSRMIAKLKSRLQGEDLDHEVVQLRKQEEARDIEDDDDEDDDDEDDDDEDDDGGDVIPGAPGGQNVVEEALN